MSESNGFEATPVLIVGAGPTGLTLACELARRGVALRIIDKAPEAPRGSRGKGLQPRTLEVFDDLGVIDQVLAAGMAYPKLRLHVWRLSLSWTMFKRRRPTADVPYPNIWLVPQARTEAILRQRLAGYGVGVEYATELTAFAQDGDGVVAELTSGGATKRLRAAYLIGADGGRSNVRKSLGVSFAGETYEHQRMLVGDVEVDGLSRDRWHVWPKTRGGAIGLCPLPDTALFQLTAQIPAGAADPELSEAGVRALVEGAVEGIRVRNPQWLSIYRPNVRMVDRYRVGRVLLAGDAAHVHPPAGGQGLNTGVQDAYNLGWKLAHVLAGASESLLDTYEEERLPIAASVLGLSINLFRQAAQRDPRASRRGDETRQLGIAYRGSSLADGGPRAGAVQAGDRAPDAPCQTGDGAPRRLFDLLRGPHFTLLAFGSGQAKALAALIRSYPETLRAWQILPAGEAPPAGALIDRGGQAARAYAATGATLALVRPDGYIGVIDDQGSLGRIAAYLERILAGCPAPAGTRDAAAQGALRAARPELALAEGEI